MKTLAIIPMLILGVSCSDSFFSKKQSESFYATKPADVGSTNGGSDGGSTNGGGDGGDMVIVNPVPLTEVTENFIQKDQAKLDIIWVVDNSGSMSDEQADLSENFDLFIQDFITKKVDFKMAITTTDPSTNVKGLMVPGSDTKLTYQVAQSNQSQFISDFKSLIKVGIKGSGNEQGLQAIQSFKNRYPNHLRADAYLAIVYVSDEQDSSPGTTDAHLAYLKSLKTNAGLVKAYSIVDKNLSNTNANITLGFDRYAKMSIGTGGLVSDIEGSFAGSLSDMSDSLINLLDSFALASAPAAGTLKVYVNDVLSSAYVYDAITHSIKFNSNAIPANSSKIKVIYKK
jgi:hypothetical protein